jgi:hypothetical protein
MQEEIINKILKINSTSQKTKIANHIILNIQDNTLYLNTLEFKNIYTTDISSLSSNYKDLFFAYFPYQITNLESSKKNLPCRIFFNTSNNFMYLLSENTQKEIQEYCPYLDYIKNLNFWGTLKQKNDKSVYLEIDNRFFINLISSILDNKIEKLTNFDINVITKDEYKKHEVFPIYEIDQKFEFKIKDLYSINIDNETNTQKIWFLEIESKDLEELRYKYHLFPKMNGHNFSINLGFIKYFKLRKSYPKMMINFTVFAA